MIQTVFSPHKTGIVKAMPRFLDKNPFAIHVLGVSTFAARMEARNPAPFCALNPLIELFSFHP
jgi:hypothetical protein